MVQKPPCGTILDGIILGEVVFGAGWKGVLLHPTACCGTFFESGVPTGLPQAVGCQRYPLGLMCGQPLVPVTQALFQSIGCQ